MAEVSFGTWLRQRRRALDLTQDELARQVGCSTIALRKIEAEERRPSKQIAERLAELLDVAPAERPAFVRYARGELLTGAPPRPERTSPLTSWRTPLYRSTPIRLPAPLTPLIGREQDIALVRRYLLRKDTRLLTLVGPPGIGKTRLGLQVAAEVLDHFDDGVFFIALAPVRDPHLVATIIAQTLGLKETSAQPLVGRLTNYLWDKQLLLLLDNFEQVVDAATIVTDLLAAGPRLKALVTSRVALRVRAERQFPVPPLGLPDPTRLPQPPELVQYPALALFVERAQAVQPDFYLTEANAATVAHLCHRLDGLPLAIELIAARVRLLSPAEILHRLGGRFLLQSDGQRDIDERQRTLKNAIEWSYNLLVRDEQTLFARLAVFVGGWTLDAAESVCGNEASSLTTPVLDLLALLVNKSLVVRHEVRDGSHFALLETIREYALEQLAALPNGEAKTVRRRHASYYLRLAEAARSQLTGTQQVRWLDRLENEHGNLRAALGWALESGNLIIAAQLGGALWHFWAMHGHLSEGRQWLERTLATETDQVHLPPSMQVVLLNGAGSLAYYQGDHAAARLYFGEGLALARQVGDQWNMAFALDGLGAQSANQGDYEQAQAFSEQSLTLSKTIGDKWLSGVTLINLGELARVQGDYERAVVCYESSLALLREGGDRLFAAIALDDLGQVAQDQGRYEQAQAIHQESLSLCRELGYQRGVAMCLEKLAGVAAAQGQAERAVRLLGAAEALRQAVGSPGEGTDRLDYERFIAMARARLDEESFATAWEKGRAMTLVQAIAYALEAEPSSHAPAIASPSAPQSA